LKHLVNLIFIHLFFITGCYAQFSKDRRDKWFISGAFEGMNYFGDLQDKIITTNEMHFAVSGGISYQVIPHLSTNLYLTLGSVGASDSKNGERWKYRNLSFESDIFEAALTAEYDILDMETPDKRNKFTPYIFAGVGVFHFNPYTYDESGKKVYLQPLGTEGETTPYSLWQFCIPFGVGAKVAVSSTVRLSAEFNIRKLFTDYLDDVSQHQYADTTQLLITHGPEAVALSYRADEIPNSPYKSYGYRGNPGKNDGYYSFIIRASLQLFTGRFQ
jgi:hypothetical protein